MEGEQHVDEEKEIDRIIKEKENRDRERRTYSEM
jgi:hypothetical protein